MKIGGVFWDHNGCKHIVISKFEDLGEEFIVCRYFSKRKGYKHSIEWVRFLGGDFKNNRKFKSRYLFLKWKRN